MCGCIISVFILFILILRAVSLVSFRYEVFTTSHQFCVHRFHRGQNGVDLFIVSVFSVGGEAQYLVFAVGRLSTMLLWWLEGEENSEFCITMLMRSDNCVTYGLTRARACKSYTASTCGCKASSS